MILKQLIEESVKKLSNKNFPTPRLDTDLMFEKALNCSRTDLYVNLNDELSLDDVEKCKQFLVRRLQGEPVAYILGEKEFFCNQFKVNPSVLIPRPETEEIVEQTLARLNKIKENDKSGSKFYVLDLGTGSGCIGLSIAKADDQVKLTAVDISESAIEVARDNAKDLGVSDRVLLICKDSEKLNLEDLTNNKQSKFDVVVSNPPYIAIGSNDVDPYVKAFEPQQALFAEEQGMKLLKSWSKKALSLMKPGGFAIFEIGYDQGEAFKNYLHSLEDCTHISIGKDLAGKDRYALFEKSGSDIPGLKRQ